MAVTQLEDVIIPAEFTSYVVQESVVSTALFQSGVLARNGQMNNQLAAGASFFAIPEWLDLGENEPNISDDSQNPATPLKLSANRQIVRKSFINQAWSSMALAAELAGSNPLEALRDRVTAYWDRTVERRIVATLNGILQSNVTNNASDMVTDISGGSGNAAKFSAAGVITAAATLGDRLDDVKAIAMHSAIYSEALANDLIEFIPQSQGLPIKTFRGLAVIIDDNLTPASGVYTTVLLGYGALGYAVTDPNNAPGTEIWRQPLQGMGGGQDTLISRINLSLHPLGFSWNENSLATVSPAITDLSSGTHWLRVAPRKAIPLAFLLSK